MPDSDNWQQLDYKCDVGGRRSEKLIDGYATRYVHDGGHIIAEYDGNNNLLRKYIYGPGVDKPVSMIEVADSNATYYYHYDALGSVIALSDSSGDTVQTYEYSVYGEVAVEDANHTNPYMFAGRRFDIEIGLYYSRARYYNPYTGRFLQTDPIGYGDGMSMYAYCKNNPQTFVDPSGTLTSEEANLQIWAHRGGHWAWRQKVRRYPGTWKSWVDFFAWYAHGGGDTVRLTEVGLLADFRNEKQIKDWTEAKRLEMNAMAEAFARAAIAEGKSEATKRPFRIRMKYNFFEGGFREHLWELIGQPSAVPEIGGSPLIVLGNGILHGWVEIQMYRMKDERGRPTLDVMWVSQITYGFVDRFEDPADFDNSIPGNVEWLFCTPYFITGWFGSLNTGTFMAPFDP